MRTLSACLLVAALAGTVWADCNHNTAPTPDARTGIGEIDYQLCHWEDVYNPMVQQLVTYLNVAPLSVTIPDPKASDDGIPFPWIAVTPTTLQRISCRTEGACATPPVFSFQTDTGSAITFGGSLSCATGASPASPVTVAGGSLIAAGHGFRFSITNTPSVDCTYAVLSVVAAESMP